MSRMKEIAERLGVEINEIFTTELMEDIWFKFTEKGLKYYDDFDEMWWLTTEAWDYDYTTKLLSGEDKVIKLRKVNNNKYERI